ncbi:MAG: hypothetical protein AB7J40_00135 [Candidatus Altimarinota bacterium]
MEEMKVQSVSFRENETFLKSFSDGPRRDKGQLFLILDLPDNPGAEDALAEKIWRTLHDSFFNCESDDPYYCFEESLKGVNTVLDQENQKRQAGTIGRLYAIAGLLQDGTLHFAHAGHASVYLKRGDQFSRISEALDGEVESGFHSISSGALSLDDTIVFSSRHLPFDDLTLSEVFANQGAKLVNQLKLLSKQKELTGLVSSFVISEGVLSEETADAPEAEPLAAESIPEEGVPLTEMPPEKPTKRSNRMLDSLKKRIDGSKVDAAKKAARGVMAGVGSRFSKIIKKPERIKQVNRRYVLLGVIVLVVALGALLVFQSGYREKAAEAAKYEQLLYQVKTNIEVAENRFLIGEKTDANDFLNKAAVSLQEIEAAGYYQTDVEKMKKEISLYRDNFDAIVRVENPNVFIDLSDKGTVDALGMVHTQDQKNYVYEPRRLFESLLDKVQEGLTIDPEEIVLSGAELEDFNVLSFITQSGQIIEYSTRNGSFERAKTQDETWKKGVDIKTYNGEFIYLLDSSANTIWKYRRLRTGYSTASAYSSQGDLSNAVSLTIDGNIYVLLRDGTIVKYLKGAVEPFEIKDQPSVPLKNPSRIFTLPEANNLYVLDSANRRVVVYSKGSGGISRYQKQIVFDSLKPNEIRDFYVDKDEQKIVVLTANKAYIADL